MKLLASVLANAIEQTRKIDECISGGGDIYLFGAGGVGRWSLEYLRERGYKVKALIDNSKKKQGTLIEGVPVIPLEEFDTADKDCIVFITAKHRVLEVLAQLRSVSTAGHIISFDTWEGVHDIAEYERIWGELSDEKSRTVLEAMMNSKLTGDNKYLAAVAKNHAYFCLPGFFGCPCDDTFVDIGCYVGDTIEEFIAAKTGSFEHIYGFDVGNRQIAAAKERIARLKREWAFDEDKITLVNVCLGKEDDKMFIKEEALLGCMGTACDTGQAVQVVTLDSYFKDTRVSFLKSDIEGSEMDMLLGAEKVIKRDKPKMALCVYHRCDDLFKMADTIRRYVPEYKLALRHHSAWQADTVLYCWV